MKEAYELARQNISKSAGDAMKQYDQKERFSNLQLGDRVLVRNLSERGGPEKLRPQWEQQQKLCILNLMIWFRRNMENITFSLYLLTVSDL